MDHPPHFPAPAEPPTHAAPWVRSFLLALFVYAALRAWILATAFDAVSVPVYEIPTIGSYGWALFEGVSLLPWNDHYDNAGAQILTGWLSVVSFKLFGASYLALKLVPMAFGMLLLAMVGRVLARQFSGRAALIGMLSVAVAPPIVTKYSMLAKGNHFEGLTLLFVAILMALETPEPGSPRRRLWVGLTGGALGFAIAMYFGAMLTGVVLAVAWWIRFGLMQSLRDTPVFAAGLGVGLIPLLLINLSTGGRAKSYGANFGSANAGLSVDGLLEKGQRLITEELPGAACFNEAFGMPTRIAETIFLALVVISWCFAAGAWLRTFKEPKSDASAPSLGERRRKRATLWILIAYPIGVLAVLILKELPITSRIPPVEVLGVRYLLGYFFFSLLLVAVAVDGLLRSRLRVARSVAWALGLGLLFTWPFNSAVASTRWSDRGDALAYPAVHLRQYSLLFHRDLHLGESMGVDTTRMKACLDNLSEAGHPDQRSELALGLGFFLTMAKLGYDGTAGDHAFDVDAITLDFDTADHPDLLRGVGMCFQAAVRSRKLAPLKNGDPSPLRQRISAALAHADAAPWVAEGFGMTQHYPLARRLPTQLLRSRSLLAVVPDELRRSTLKGIARTLRDHADLGLGRSEERVQAELEHFEPLDQLVLRSFLGSETRASVTGPPQGFAD